MILGFKTQINGKPTHFVEKIWEGFLQKGIQFKVSEMNILKEALPKDYVINTYSPKLHTFRIDDKNRWKKGMMIDYFINVRTKNMFRFAPRIPVLSIQKTTMSYSFNDIINIYVDGKELTGAQRLEFSRNDGFDNWDDFFNYFYPLIKNTSDNYLKGKLIHWTDKKY